MRKSNCTNMVLIIYGDKYTPGLIGAMLVEQVIITQGAIKLDEMCKDKFPKFWI